MESQTTNQILRWLNAKEGTWAMKIHGGPYQRAGMPDILCVHNGFAIFIEVKESGRPTKLQERTLKVLRDKAGAITVWVQSFAELDTWWDVAIEEAQGGKAPVGS